MQDIIDFVYNHVWWYVFGMVKIEADTDDIVQDLCLMICLRQAFFGILPLDDQKAFVMRSAKNKVIDRYRNNKRSFAFEREQKTDPDIYGKIYLKEITNFLNKEEASRQLLDFARGMSIAEIQNEYKVSLSCAVGRNFNTRQKLKKAFK